MYQINPNVKERILCSCEREYINNNLSAKKTLVNLADHIVKIDLSSLKVIGIIFSILYKLLGLQTGCECLLHQYVIDIENERKRQIKKFGDNNKNNSLDDWRLILYEEYGEFVQAFNNNNINHTYNEAVQTSAVWLQIIETYLEKMRAV